MQRGLLSTNRGAPDKGYVEKTKKFQPPKSDLLSEEFLDNIQPRDNVKVKQIKQWIKERRQAVIKAAAKTMKGATAYQKEVIKSDMQATLNAWNMWEIQVEHANLSGEADAEFSKSFFAWLQGKGVEDDHQKTPWYRHRINDKEVRSYVNSFAEAKIDFIQALQRLVIKANTTGLDGISEHYLFYKYIVRGGWEDRSSAEFLYDWNKYLGWKEDVPATKEGVAMADPKSTPANFLRKAKQWWTADTTATKQLFISNGMTGYVEMQEDYGAFWRSARVTTKKYKSGNPKKDEYKDIISLIQIDPEADTAGRASLPGVISAPVPVPDGVADDGVPVTVQDMEELKTAIAEVRGFMDESVRSITTAVNSLSPATVEQAIQQQLQPLNNFLSAKTSLGCKAALTR